MTRSIVLHIGTHKTGSTSLQQLLHDEREGCLARVGVAYPPGLVLPASHAELPLLAVRPDRMWPARLRLPETQRPEWLAMAQEHVRHTVRHADRDVLVLSHEDLSYVRHDDELERLRGLFEGVPVRVIVFRRDAAAFLRSYRSQLEATGFPLSDDPTSFAYTEADSWLVDHETLTAGYRRWFGDEAVETIDYDEAVARDGSIIPAFTGRLGIAPGDLPPLEPYFLNRSGTHLRPSSDALMALRRRLAEQAP